ncbi:MAG: rhombosortase [Planctomycetes bacterium]|nr:rhombosortase [Planctomycetota bacterium]
MQDVAHGAVPARLRPWLALLLVAAVCAGILLAGDRVAHALRYERNALLDGQLWRALTGHLVHVSWLHLGLELAGAVVIVGVLRRHLHWGAAVLCALGATAGLFLFGLRVHHYCGLQAVLHGLVVYGALIGWRRDRLKGWLVALMLVVASIVFDMASGDARLTGAEEPLATAAGAASGALAFAILYRPSRTRL